MLRSPKSTTWKETPMRMRSSALRAAPTRLQSFTIIANGWVFLKRNWSILFNATCFGSFWSMLALKWVEKYLWIVAKTQKWFMGQQQLQRSSNNAIYDRVESGNLATAAAAASASADLGGETKIGDSVSRGTAGSSFSFIPGNCVASQKKLLIKFTIWLLRSFPPFVLLERQLSSAQVKSTATINIPSRIVSHKKSNLDDKSRVD